MRNILLLNFQLNQLVNKNVGSFSGCILTWDTKPVVYLIIKVQKLYKRVNNSVDIKYHLNRLVGLNKEVRHFTL